MYIIILLTTIFSSLYYKIYYDTSFTILQIICYFWLESFYAFESFQFIVALAKMGMQPEKKPKKKDDHFKKVDDKNTKGKKNEK